jgi:tetratricopeptide (TPR) repeat protein
MNFKQEVLTLCIAALFAGFLEPAAAENYPLIIRGKVVMTDGTPPPIRVAVERYCSDGFGSAPGPLTDKNGEYLWRMNVDPMRSRACVIRATHAGYTSSSIDISALNGYLSTTITLDPIIISSPADDPYTISMSESNMPIRAKSELKAALKALDTRNYPEAVSQFRKATEDAPKYAPGWHALGVVLDHQDALKESREAFEKAIESDSRFIPAYILLVHTCSKLKDWDCVVKTADALSKADKKKNYPDVCFHRAVAHYKLNDLDQAAANVQEAMRLDPMHRISRAEYVYGRILEAQGDINGAREHMSKYLDLDKNVPDREIIQLHIKDLGSPVPAGREPELDFP